MNRAPTKPILLNGLFLGRPISGVRLTGREWIAALLSLIEDQPDLAPRGVTLALPPSLPPEWPGLRFAEAPPSWLKLLRAGGPSHAWEQSWLALQAQSFRILSFCNSFPLLAPDQVVWIHDTHTLDSPESYARAYRAWGAMHWQRVKHSDWPVATISAFSKSRLVAHGLKADRIQVIHCGGDHLQRTPPNTTVLAAYGLTDCPFILIVGSRAKHKNVAFAVQALLDHGPKDAKIVLVGLGQPGQYAAAGLPESGDRVVMLPPLNDAKLRALFQATALAMTPSKLEGFGLPAVEAMWEGAPVAVSNCSSLPEVGAGAALLFDPNDAASIGEAARLALSEPTATQLRAQSIARRADFTWRAGARTIIDAFF